MGKAGHFQNLCMKGLVWICAVSVLLCTAGCGKEESYMDYEVAEYTIYKEEAWPLGDYAGDIRHFVVGRQKTCIVTQEQTEAGLTYRFYECMMGENQCQQLELPDIQGYDILKLLAVEEDKLLLYAAGQKDGTCCVLCYDRNGEKIFQTEFPDEAGGEAAELFYAPGQGYIAVGRKTVCMLNSDGEIMWEIKAKRGKEIDSATLNSDSSMLLYAYRTSDGLIIQEIELQTGEAAASYTFADIGRQGSFQMYTGPGYYLYYQTEDGLYGFDERHLCSTKLVDFIASGIDSAFLDNLSVVSESCFFAVNSKDSQGFQLMRYTMEDNQDERTVIKVGGIGIDDIIQSEAAVFNKENNEYRIELIDYSDLADAELRIQADIIAGNAPDIILLDGLSVSQYAAMGVLEPLDAYMENSNGEFRREDLLDNVEAALRQEGSFYFLAPYFNVDTMAVRGSAIRDVQDWNMEEFKLLLGGKPDMADDISKSDLLFMLAGSSLESFVDWENGVCRFDSAEFKAILELCILGGNESADISATDKIQLARGLLTFDEMQYYDSIFQGDAQITGFPGSDGGCSRLLFGCQLGIYSGTTHKEAAWKFIEAFMGRRYQYECAWRGFPTRRDIFDMVMDEAAAVEEYTNGFGITVKPRNSSMSIGDYNVELEPLSRRQLEMIRDTVTNTSQIWSFDYKIYEIVSEEAAAYFAGEKAVDEVAAHIQNRVTTYVNENR